MNLVIDYELLEKAQQLTGELTYSAVVNRGLRELVRQTDLDAIFHLEPGWWEGDLGAMRADAPYEPPREVDIARARENAKKIKEELHEEMKAARSPRLTDRPGMWIADAPMPEAEPPAKPAKKRK